MNIILINHKSKEIDLQDQFKLGEFGKKRNRVASGQELLQCLFTFIGTNTFVMACPPEPDSKP